MVVFTLVFGGLRCIGWDFKFPTHPEQTLWRSISLATAVLPLIVAPIDLLLSHSSQVLPNFGNAQSSGFRLGHHHSPLCLRSCTSSLIVQPLRSQPASALTAVEIFRIVRVLRSMSRCPYIASLTCLSNRKELAAFWRWFFISRVLEP